MFQSFRRYIYDRRRLITTAVGIAGTVYLIGNYVLEVLEEMRAKAIQSRNAREHLRRRFEQNQQDVSYTIMTLLPTLGEQILQQMDVERLTRELQMKSRAAKRRGTPDTAPSESSLASSVELLQEHETSSDVISLSGTSAVSTSEHNEIVTPMRWATTHSWTSDVNLSAVSQGPSLHLPSEAPIDHGSPYSNTSAYLSDSITSESVFSASDGERPRMPRGDSSLSKFPASGSKSKNELWKDIKFLTFTRTLTIIYATALLSILTQIQLNLLGRYKYVQSVIQLRREEVYRDRRQFETTASSWFWGGSTNHDPEEDAQTLDVDNVDEVTEAKFLTVSWWLLHVGWKDVSERVRRSVEDVFENVSLKTKIDSIELHRLICEVRRKVEHETTYEGDERKTNFLSSILPPTMETLQHVLVEAGLSSDLASSPDPMFTSLLEEIRLVATSDYFTELLGACLDKATDILFKDLRNTVFTEGTPNDEGGDRDTKIRLAGMLPGLARWSHTALNGLPNELVDGMAEIREMTGFAAIIYSSYESLIH